MLLLFTASSYYTGLSFFPSHFENFRFIVRLDSLVNKTEQFDLICRPNETVHQFMMFVFHNKSNRNTAKCKFQNLVKFVFYINRHDNLPFKGNIRYLLSRSEILTLHVKNDRNDKA